MVIVATKNCCFNFKIIYGSYNSKKEKYCKSRVSSKNLAMLP